MEPTTSQRKRWVAQIRAAPTKHAAEHGDGREGVALGPYGDVPELYEEHEPQHDRWTARNGEAAQSTKDGPDPQRQPQKTSREQSELDDPGEQRSRAPRPIERGLRKRGADVERIGSEQSGRDRTADDPNAWADETRHHAATVSRAKGHPPRRRSEEPSRAGMSNRKGSTELIGYPYPYDAESRWRARGSRQGGRAHRLLIPIRSPNARAAGASAPRRGWAGMGMVNR